MASLELAAAREHWGAREGAAGRHLRDHRPGARFEFAMGTAAPSGQASRACPLALRPFGYCPTWLGGAAIGSRLPGKRARAAAPRYTPRPRLGWRSGTARPARGALGGSSPVPASPSRLSGGGRAEFRFRWLRPRAGSEAGKNAQLALRLGACPSPPSGWPQRGGLCCPRHPFWAMVRPDGASVSRRR